MMKILLSSAAVLGTVALVSMATAAGTGGAGCSAMSGCGTGGCGMGTAATTQPTTQASSYVCPMDKDVTSDKPGKCSKCGMKLVPAEKSVTAPAHDHDAH